MCWRNQEISSLLREMGLGTSLAWGSGLGECRGAFYGGVFFFLWDFAARGCKYQSAVPILFIIIYLNILSCWFHWQQLLGQIFFFFKCTGPSGGNPRFPFCGQIKNKKQKKKTNKPISSIQNLANWGLSLISTIIRVLCRCLVSMKRWKWPKNKNYKFFFFKLTAH